jgi:hypothetical protein
VPLQLLLHLRQQLLLLLLLLYCCTVVLLHHAHCGCMQYAACVWQYIVGSRRVHVMKQCHNNIVQCLDEPVRASLSRQQCIVDSATQCAYTCGMVKVATLQLQGHIARAVHAPPCRLQTDTAHHLRTCIAHGKYHAARDAITSTLRAYIKPQVWHADTS